MPQCETMRYVRKDLLQVTTGIQKGTCYMYNLLTKEWKTLNRPTSLQCFLQSNTLITMVIQLPEKTGAINSHNHI